MDEEAYVFIWRLWVQSSHSELDAHAVGWRDENGSLSWLTGTGCDALSSVWTVAYHADMVASLHELRRWFARESHCRRDEVQQREVESLATARADVPRTRRCSYSNWRWWHVAGQVTRVWSRVCSVFWLAFGNHRRLDCITDMRPSPITNTALKGGSD